MTVPNKCKARLMSWHLLVQVLEPLVAKGAAIDACNTLCAWLKARQADLFLPM